VWRYVYRAVDQHGQVIDVLVSPPRGAAAVRRFFARALRALNVTPSEVVADAAPVYPAVLDELLGSGWTRSRSTRTTRSKPITAPSSADCDRCADSRPIGSRKWSSPGTPSCRTCDAATTTSRSTIRRPQDSLLPSPNSPEPSDQRRPRTRRACRTDNATASHSNCSATGNQAAGGRLFTVIRLPRSGRPASPGAPMLSPGWRSGRQTFRGGRSVSPPGLMIAGWRHAFRRGHRIVGQQVGADGIRDRPVGAGTGEGEGGDPGQPGEIFG
jgi:hypothetical protein